jgi:hypothetical protein
MTTPSGTNPRPSGLCSAVPQPTVSPRAPQLSVVVVTIRFMQTHNHATPCTFGKFAPPERHSPLTSLPKVFSSPWRRHIHFTTATFISVTYPKIPISTRLLKTTNCTYRSEIRFIIDQIVPAKTLALAVIIKSSGVVILQASERCDLKRFRRNRRDCIAPINCCFRYPNGWTNSCLTVTCTMICLT